MNFKSDEWNALVKEITARMGELDLLNRNPGLSQDATALLRGQFKALQWILDWPERQSLVQIEGDSE